MSRTACPLITACPPMAVRAGPDAHVLNLLGQEESWQQQEQYNEEEAQQQQQQQPPEQAQEQEQQQQQQEPASRQDRIGFIGAGQVCGLSCGTCCCTWAVLQGLISSLVIH